MTSKPVPSSPQNAEVFGRNNVVVQIQGDGNTVVPGLAHLTLTRYLNRRRGGEGPSGEAAEILSPYALAIPFIGREPVMADLWTWMEKDQPVSVRVLTARGGGGKTRLALELCDDATRKGWFAGFATDRELQRFLAQQNLSAWGWNRPTLVVVDYAASRARLLRDWLIELADNAADSVHSLRLLLLERFADPDAGWWPAAFGRGGGDALAIRRLLDPVNGPYTLPSLTAPERRVVFAATLERAGSLLRPPETSDFDHRLAELSWGGEPLFLMMAGLTAARAGLGQVLALSPTDVAFEVAEHELKRIRQIGEGRGIDPDFLAHMASYVTLCQGLSRSQAEETIATEKCGLRYDSAGDPPRIYQALRDALPGGSQSVSPVLPDIVGEVVLLLALGAGNPEKAEDAVARAWSSAGERVLPVVMRTADDFGSVRKETLGWLTRLVREGGEDDEAIVRVANQLPSQTVALREAALELTATLVEKLRQKQQKGPLAIWLNNLSVRLGDMGLHEEALEACWEAVSVCRELVLWRPEAFRPDLALLLTNLASRLSAMGLREEALEACQEAVSIRRELVAWRPAAFRPDLARSLNDLSIWLRAVGRRRKALEACQEAVSILRELVSSHLEDLHIDLALSLDNLSIQLSAMGLHKEGLEVCQEAVSLYRELASWRPAAFRPDLGRSLNNLSLWLSAVGLHGKALEACREAVSIRRELASSHPEAFRPDLAVSLNNLVPLLSAVGYQTEALKTCQEALSICRELASWRPAVFRSDLATSLNNLALLLSVVGYRDEALDKSQEAVSLYRDLAAARPEAFRPDLAGTLFNLSGFCGEAGQLDRAVESCREAVELLIPFFVAIPVAFRERMVKMVNRYLYLVGKIGLQLDPDLLMPLVKANFFETETEDSTTTDATTSDSEEEPR